MTLGELQLCCNWMRNTDVLEVEKQFRKSHSLTHLLNLKKVAQPASSVNGCET